MKRAQYTRIFAEGDPGLLEACVQEIEASASVRIMKQPETGLLMHKAKDAVSGQPFYLGELLVTECTVQLGDTPGYGVCLGEDPDKAYGLAVADAAFKAGREEGKRWIPLLLKEEQAILKRQRLEHNQIMKTRVQFETADEYFDRGR